MEALETRFGREKNNQTMNSDAAQQFFKSFSSRLNVINF
jgi:hypothetical protein